MTGVESQNILDYEVGSGVAQLVERLLPTLEVRGSNPFIGKLFIKHFFIVNCSEKGNKEKEAVNGTEKNLNYGDDGTRMTDDSKSLSSQ